MKKNIIILCFLLLQSISLVKGQDITNTISGRILGYKILDSVFLVTKIFDFDNITRNKNPEKLFRIPIGQDGNFKLEFSAVESRFYVSFELHSREKSIKQLMYNITFKKYLFNKNDHVNIDFNFANKTVSFTGVGAEKLSCQYEIFSLAKASQGYIPTPFPSSYERYLQMMDSTLNAYITQEKRILFTYKDRIDETTCDRIYQDMISKAKLIFISRLTNSHQHGVKENKEPIRKYFLENYKNKKSILSKNDSLDTSPEYTDFLYLRDCMVFLTSDDLKKSSSYFDWMFKNINSNYSGLLKERLIINSFLADIVAHSNNVLSYLPAALEIVKNQKNKLFLKDWKLTQTKGNEVLNFSFLNHLGKKIALSDYANQIILLDFWFTGCIPCKMMTPKMESIVRRYKDRDDIVFLSISVDGNKDTWLKSISGGEYTCKDQIVLKTSELGRNDPFLLNYGINSFPRLLLIGKQGKLIAAYPPDPRKDNGIGIIKIIDEALQNDIGGS